MSPQVPGTSGLPVVGETLHFLKDIRVFFDTRIAQYGRLFRSKILGTSTIFSCSYYSTLQVLQSHPQQNSNQPFVAHTAYNEFMKTLYLPSNPLLLPDDHKTRSRATHLLHSTLQTPLPKYRPVVRSLVHSAFSKLPSDSASNPFAVYPFLKRLTERIVTTIVLGSLPKPQYLRIRRLCSQHLNGIVAVPINVGVMGVSSARRAAVNAHATLVKLIRDLVQAEMERDTEQSANKGSILAQLVAQMRDDEMDEVVQVLVLLLSSLIPKALASALTSSIVLLSDPKYAHVQQAIRRDTQQDQFETADMLLMEILRLFPPLAGGMRVANRKVEIATQKYALSHGVRVWYSYLDSNRDEAAFEKADNFDLDRWSGHRDEDAIGGGCPFLKAGQKRDANIPLSFGAGDRQCPGRDLAWMMMRECVTSLVVRFDISGGSMQDLDNVRYMPVVRTIDDVRVILQAV